MNDIFGRIGRRITQQTQNEEDARLEEMAVRQEALRQHGIKIREAYAVFERFRHLASQHRVPFNFPKPTRDNRSSSWGWIVAVDHFQTGVQMGDPVFSIRTYALSASGKVFVAVNNEKPHEASEEEWLFDISCIETYITNFVVEYGLPWNE